MEVIFVVLPLSYFFGPSQVIPCYVFTCINILKLVGWGRIITIKLCSSTFNVAAERSINTDRNYIPPIDHKEQATLHTYTLTSMCSHTHTHTHTHVHYMRTEKEKKQNQSQTTKTNKHLTHQSETQSQLNESHRVCLTGPLPVWVVKGSLARRLTGLYLLLFRGGHLFHCLH